MVLTFNLQKSMQNCRPPSFLCTNTMVLHHGLYLGQIAPTSFTCAQTISTIGGVILWNLSLKGSPSTTLISCFARSIQPNSPCSKERCHGIQLVGLRQLLGFCQTIPPGQITLVAGKASPSSAQLTS